MKFYADFIEKVLKSISALMKIFFISLLINPEEKFLIRGKIMKNFITKSH